MTSSLSAPRGKEQALFGGITVRTSEFIPKGIIVVEQNGTPIGAMHAKYGWQFVPWSDQPEPVGDWRMHPQLLRDLEKLASLSGGSPS